MGSWGVVFISAVTLSALAIVFGEPVMFAAAIVSFGLSGIADRIDRILDIMKEKDDKSEEGDQRDPESDR